MENHLQNLKLNIDTLSKQDTQIYQTLQSYFMQVYSLQNRLNAYEQGRLLPIPRLLITKTLNINQFQTIFAFLPFKQVLQLRLINKDFDMIVLYFLKIHKEKLITELEQLPQEKENQKLKIEQFEANEELNNQLKERWAKNLADNIDKISVQDLTEIKANKKPVNLLVRITHAVCSLTVSKVVFFENEKEDGPKSKPTNMGQWEYVKPFLYGVNFLQTIKTQPILEEGITEDQIKVIEELDDLSVEKANKCSKVGGYLLGYLLETLNVYKEYEVLKMKGELKNFNLHEENLKKKIEAFEKLTNK